MAKRTILELEKGKIEFSDDGETKIYTYQETPIDQLSEDQIKEIRESQVMDSFIKAFNGVAEVLARVFNQLKETVVPALNAAMKQIQEAEAEAAKAKAKKKKPAKKVKTDEAK